MKPERKFEIKERYEMQDLLALMASLRGENGCPWDKEQTHQSIRKNLIEETYEVVEAIDKEDTALLREELGDLLLQVVFHTQMEEEAETFAFDDVVTELCQKLVVRHPHVFGSVVAEDAGTVLKNWDAIKRETKEQKTVLDTLEAVPALLPALMRAKKVQQRASRAGLDFKDANAAFDRLIEETDELNIALCDDNADAIADELGDLLFSCCNVARLKGLDPEECLTAATNKFTSRVGRMEALANAEGTPFESLSYEALDALWNQAKE